MLSPNRKRFLIISSILFICLVGFSQQEQKNLEAIRTPVAPKIDGQLNELMWQDALPADDFIQYSPYNAAAPSQPTVVKIMYDDRALYIGAMMYDSAPDSIFRELGVHDDEDINADFFSIDIIPYNDGLNAFEFKVSASGVEVDIKHAANYNDEDWNPIWKSSVKINDSGWVAEIEIPYAAIRFPKTAEQLWGLNMWRSIRRYREWSTWNYVDNTLDGVFNQSGTLTGIKDIKPPLRLFFIPYVAGYTEKVPESESWAYSYNYGMDMKLGLSESFTLDLTLVPDFGQVQSDDKIVNLSPFEVYYQERRPFFTEGTELFERGDIFYTRRVGGTPDGYWDVEDEYESEDIIENPQEIQLVNATKVSGRTKKGTGLGVFNAVNTNSWAKVIDSTGVEQKILTHPSTNYNMLVFDQSLKNNSFVSVYNTNMYQGRDRYIANVSGTEFELRNKQNMWGIGGLLNVSQQYYTNQENIFGYTYNVVAGKISGNFRFNVEHETQNDTYDVNDMGFNRRNNRFDNDAELEYNIYEPFGNILNMHNSIGFYYDMLYAPREYVSLTISSRNRTTFSNFLTAGINWWVKPIGTHDYYEPRVDGWMLVNPATAYFGVFISPDYRKRFVIDANASLWTANMYAQSGYHLEVEPRFRVNDRLSLILEMSYDIDNNSIGYVTDSIYNNEEKIIMGRRDVQTVENTLEGQYIFTKNISLSLRARQYWVTVGYDQYYNLQEDGYLNPSSYNENHDFTFNAFNVDMVFRWIFAPASELIFVWKNNIYAEKSEVITDYFEDLRYTFTSPMGNSFSLKVLYYLDSQKFKKKRR